MEESVTVDSSQFSKALAAAEIAGAILPPGKLLIALEGAAYPVAVLSDFEKGNALFETFNEEFAFIQTSFITRQPLSAEDQMRWANLIRWTIKELRQWRRSDDPKCEKIVAIFVVIHSCDRSSEFWNALSTDLSDNKDLVEALAALLGSLNVSFSSWKVSTPSIWETEEVERFKQAEARADWVVVAECWKKFTIGIFPSVIITQTVRCLYRYGFDRLVKALSGLCQTPIAMLVAGALIDQHRLDLAIASDNPYVQFACAYQTLSRRQNALQLSVVEQERLTVLLNKVSNNGDQWRSWMLIFNRYPAHYPVLQTPLGRVLATVPELAIENYVGSIDLNTTLISTPGDSRRYVAECLRTFREVADQDRRRTLWTMAHERWSAWRFDSHDHDKYLFGIGCSELDYAVVAYVIECMDDPERKVVIDSIHQQLIFLDKQWYASISDCITSWNRLLSQFQPYAHAAQAIFANNDWLADRPYYLFDLQGQNYLKMMYPSE